MDLYVVDNTFKKIEPVIDGFTSVVWTDRYAAYGEIVLVLPATLDNQAMITEGMFLHTPDSPEIMLVHTVSIKNRIMTVLGCSLVEFLKHRLFRKSWSGAASSWTTTGANSAGNIINIFMQDLANPATFLTGGTVLTSGQGTDEIIPNLTLGTAVSGTGLVIAVSYGNLYDAIKQVADADALGFTMYPPAIDGSSAITFKAYRGLDRTTSQSTNTPVIFDPAMDNLSDTEELRSIQGYKNVAWVWPQGITAQNQIEKVYVPGASGLTSWLRRTLMVEASDINVADFSAPDLADILQARGRDALANNNYVKMVDGQIVPQNAYKYGTDYNLGDIVELRGITTGISQAARVTEYIRAQDNTGEQAYPTLSIV